jgi:hypothetical protein
VSARKHELASSCALCGFDDHLTIDHVIPRSWGGGDTAEDVQTLCWPCHWRKFRVEMTLRAVARRRREQLDPYRRLLVMFWKREVVQDERPVSIRCFCSPCARAWHRGWRALRLRDDLDSVWRPWSKTVDGVEICLEPRCAGLWPSRSDGYDVGAYRDNSLLFDKVLVANMTEALALGEQWFAELRAGKSPDAWTTPPTRLPKSATELIEG